MDSDDDSGTSEQRKSKAFPQPIDPKNMSINEIRRSEDSNVNNSLVKEIVSNSNYDLINKPEVSYSSMHNGLSSPEPSQKNKIESSSSINEHLSSSNLFVLEKPIINNDSFVKVEETNIEYNDKPSMPNKKESIISLFDNILHSNISQIQQFFYLITEKEEIQDYLMCFHKVYEVSLYSKLGNEKETKCFRCYDNFDKFHHKIKTKYPYIMIPRLTPKNPLVKIKKFEEEFYENRRLQLIFYINFIANHSLLSKSKEFDKFINDVKYDVEYFTSDESLMNSVLFSTSPSEMIKTKLITVWNYLRTSGSSRKLNDSEILINKMAIHYRNIIDKYSVVNNAICDYIRSIKEDTSDNKALSETLFYIKDSFENVEGSKDKLNNFSNYSSKIYLANNRHYFIENKLEALISFLLGICDSFDKYAEFIQRYENVTLMLKSAKENNWDNINLIISEYDMCEVLKNKFDVHLSQEANDYIDLFDDMTTEILDQFKILLMNVNSEILQ